MKQEIYVEAIHPDFWWGLYGFMHATAWEDLIFYEKQGDSFVRLGSVCLCSRSYLEPGLEELAAEPNEKDFVEKIKHFLQTKTLVYHYYYDKPTDEDFYEVAFEAERNEQGIKPCSIEMWYPGDGIDLVAVETCTRAFCEKFLKKQAEVVLFKEIFPFEQAAEEYKAYVADMNSGPIHFSFTDEVVKSAAKQWEMSEEETWEILHKRYGKFL